MNVRYASDPYWGEKAADFYRTFDMVMQGRDRDISYLVSEQPVTVYSSKKKTLYCIERELFLALTLY